MKSLTPEQEQLALQIKQGDKVNPIDLAECQNNRHRRIREALPDSCCVLDTLTLGNRLVFKVQNIHGSSLMLDASFFKF